MLRLRGILGKLFKGVYENSEEKRVSTLGCKCVCVCVIIGSGCMDGVP